MVDSYTGLYFKEKSHNTLFRTMVCYTASFLFEFGVFSPAIVSLFCTGQI
ncbi:hypothetical protein Barb6_00383 [Bacteroidales bacterium Barb6]|nr:hypothetical protein Barb6_00383 [Bacteroidales bacterium Barb6]